MRKKLIISGGILTAIVAVILLVVFLVQPWKFRLDDEYYGKSEFTEIDTSELEELIREKKTFAVFVYQPACRASDDFEKILTEFSEQNQISFEKIAFSKLKDSGLMEGLKYYPSAVIYHDGKIVDFLRADEDEDMAAYETLDGFKEWWRGYVK